MDIDSLAQALFGSKRAETQEVSTDGTTRTYTGVALTDSEDGTVVIDLGGDVTLPDDLYDEDGNVVAEWDGVGVEMPTSPQVSAGDDVIVTLMGGSSTKTPMVTSSAGSGDRMRTLVNAAQTVANAAQAVAEAVNQHFFADTSGIHVTEATQEDWDESHTGANVLINSIGQLFRDGLNNLLALTTENGARSLTVWDGLGNAAENIRAIIGETIQLGKSDGKHLSIDSDSVDLMDGTTTLATFGADETHLGIAGASTLYMADDKAKLKSESSHWDVTGADRQSTELSTKLEMPSDENSYTYSSLRFSHSILDGIYDPGYASDTWSQITLEASASADDIGNEASLSLRATLSGSNLYAQADKVYALDPYNDSDWLQIGNPQRLTASGSYTAGTNDTRGPSVTLTAGIWLVHGIWSFTNSSSNSKRLVVGLDRSSTGNAFTWRIHTTASSSYAHRLELVDIVVISAASEKITLYGGSNPASTSAATQFITAVRLA